MHHSSSLVAENVKALRNFVDRDGVSVREGQELGELHRGGLIRSEGPPKQSWWTQKDGAVTANFAGDASRFVGPAKTSASQ